MITKRYVPIWALGTLFALYVGNKEINAYARRISPVVRVFESRRANCRNEQKDEDLDDRGKVAKDEVLDDYDR